MLLPLTKKDDESVNSTKQKSNHLFTTISGKKLLKERGDIRTIAEKFIEDEVREVPKKFNHCLMNFCKLSKNWRAYQIFNITLT